MSAHQKTCRFYDRIAELLAVTPNHPETDVIDKLTRLGNIDQTFFKWADTVPPARTDKKAHHDALYILHSLWIRLMSYDESAMAFGSKRHIALNEARLAVLRTAVRLDSNRVGGYTRYLLRRGPLLYRVQAVLTYFLGHLDSRR